MIRLLRSRVQRWRLLIPITVLAFVLSPYTQVTMQAAEGDLDPSFGAGGIVTTDFGGKFDSGNAIAVQPDGKIVAAGTSFAGFGDFAVARYNPDGSLDSTFGTGGQVTIDLGGGSADVARALAIQADGKIVVAGDTTGAISPFDGNFALVRYNGDGSLDPTFDTDGIVITDFGATFFEGAMSVAIQSDGRIVAAGGTFNATTQIDFAVARYNPDGSLDATFDGDGRVTTPVSLTNFDFAASVAIQADGMIVAAGLAGGDFGLVRYNVDGSLDTNFGPNTTGLFTTDFAGGADEATGLVIQPDGKLVVVGRSSSADFVLARYNTNGFQDPAFGSGGLVATDFPDALASASGVALQADGKILATGRYNAGVNDDVAVARYDTTGALDLTFGDGGFVVTNIATSSDDPRGIAVSPDGGILVVGQTVFGPAIGGSDFFIVRYQGPLTFFLRGDDVPGTAGGYTMNFFAPEQQVLVPPTNSPMWFSDPVVNAAFTVDSTFQLKLPCPLGVGFPKVVRVSATDSAGGAEQLLGEVAVDVQICQWQTIVIPVTAPAALNQGRVKLTIVSPYPYSPPFILGSETYLQSNNIGGTS